MRDYATVKPAFWVGDTGKALRGDTDAQLLALYLMTSPHSTMSGVFHLPTIYVAHETGLSAEAVSKALGRLIEAEFCEYDERSEFVFVRTMARHQVAERLLASDKRAIGLQREANRMPEPLRARFVDEHGERFNLICTSTYEKNGSTFEVPSMPLPSPFGGTKEGPSEGHHTEQNRTESEQNSSAAVAAVVASGHDCPQGDVTDCPHEEILALWAEVLPELPQPRAWTPIRQAHLRARWREKALNGGDYRGDRAKGLAHWRRLFGYVRESPFLMGQREGRDGRPPFQATLDWIVKPENFAKLTEGAYHGR
jgi:hypothetical protein